MAKVMRCKFRLNNVSATTQSVRENGVDKVIPGVGVQFGAVYEADDAKRNDPTNENAIFGKYTPHGSYQATIFNPALVEALPKLLGKDFYIDFTLAE